MHNFKYGTSVSTNGKCQFKQKSRNFFFFFLTCQNKIQVLKILVLEVFELVFCGEGLGFFVLFLNMG